MSTSPERRRRVAEDRQDADPQDKRAVPPKRNAKPSLVGAEASAKTNRAKSAAEDKAPGDGTAPVQAAVAAPSWLMDLRTGPFQRGFYQSLENYAIQFADRGSDKLVVSFDNLSSVRDDPVDRESWGYGFIRKNGWSHLGVMAFEPSWFRNAALFACLRDLAATGFFRRFSSVTMIGTSMGAYAATAFASLAPGCGVVAFSPQSTLKQALVPWESRFKSGRKADWNGPYADGAEEAAAASRVWLFYDPHMPEDRQHAERFRGDNILRLRARYAGHKTALFLRRAELLSTLVREAVAGTLDEPRFYQLYRRGRSLPWYLNGIADRIAASRRQERLRGYKKILIDLGRPQLASSISARYPELMQAESHH